MRQGNQIDLRTRAGTRVVAVAPAGSVEYQINAEQSRIGNLYNYARGIVLNCFLSVTRTAGSGMTPIWADRFADSIESINLNTPMDGTLIDPTVMNGCVAKNFANFVQNGYRQEGFFQTPILAASATVLKRFELYIPFSQKWNPWPDQFAKWLGWLNDGQLEIIVKSGADPFGAAGAGSDVINSVTFEAALDMVPWPEVIIPPHIVTRKYDVAASGSSNGPTLINVGTAGSLQGVEDASRLLSMVYSHQAGGFVGSGTADQIQSITMSWRDQRQTLFADSFFHRWLQDTHNRPFHGQPTAGAAITDILDTASPYPMPNSAADSGSQATGRLASSNARFTPLVWPGRDCLVSYLQKVKGNYPLDFVFSSSQSGTFRVYTQELKVVSLDKASEYLAAMGLDPTDYVLVPKLGRKNVKAQDPSKMWGLPRSVMRKKAA
jgi:hypothetical protein